MNELTKDDLVELTAFHIKIKNTHKNYYEAFNHILKNQEKAKKWDKAKLLLDENQDIVTRLKKQIEYSKSLKDDEFQIRNHIIVLLQKILGEKSQRITSTPEGRKALADFEAGA